MLELMIEPLTDQFGARLYDPKTDRAENQGGHLLVTEENNHELFAQLLAQHLVLVMDGDARKISGDWAGRHVRHFSERHPKITTPVHYFWHADIIDDPCFIKLAADNQDYRDQACTTIAPTEAVAEKLSVDMLTMIEPWDSGVLDARSKGIEISRQQAPEAGFQVAMHLYRDARYGNSAEDHYNRALAYTVATSSVQQLLVQGKIDEVFFRVHPGIALKADDNMSTATMRAIAYTEMAIDFAKHDSVATAMNNLFDLPGAYNVRWRAHRTLAMNAQTKKVLHGRTVLPGQQTNRVLARTLSHILPNTLSQPDSAAYGRLPQYQRTA